MKNLAFAFYFYPLNKQDASHDGMVRPVKNLTGVDDYPALVYADGWPYAWDYKRTLPVNPARKKIQIISVGMTCLAVRMLKILRLAAYVLDKKDDIEVYGGMIEKSEKAINENYWDDKQKCFLNRLESEKKLLDTKDVYEYLPLFSGSVDACRNGILIK